MRRRGGVPSPRVPWGFGLFAVEGVVDLATV